jgi:hypothetical protein
MEQGPIFVTGSTQSGKTLLSLMLGSHPRLATSHLEPRLWARFYSRYGDLRHRANLERCLAAMLARSNVSRFLTHSPEALTALFWQGEPSYARLFGLFYAEYAAYASKARWVDHSQDTQHYAPEIFAGLPSARIIHLIRDPRDWCAALRTKRRRARVRSGQAQLVRDVCHWAYSTRRAAGNRARFSGRYQIVRYEDLVCQPVQTLREICAFLGEPETTLDRIWVNGSAQEIALGPVNYGQLSTSAVGVYRHQLSRQSITLIQALSGANMRAWAYPLESTPMPSLQAWLMVALGRTITAAHHLRCTLGRYYPTAD